MPRLGADGPHAYRTTTYITRLTLLDAIHAIRNGKWPLEEFTLWHAELLELAAKKIREFIEAEKEKRSA